MATVAAATKPAASAQSDAQAAIAQNATGTTHGVGAHATLIHGMRARCLKATTAAAAGSGTAKAIVMSEAAAVRAAAAAAEAPRGHRPGGGLCRRAHGEHRLWLVPAAAASAAHVTAIVSEAMRLCIVAAAEDPVHRERPAAVERVGVLEVGVQSRGMLSRGAEGVAPKDRSASTGAKAVREAATATGKTGKG